MKAHISVYQWTFAVYQWYTSNIYQYTSSPHRLKLHTVYQRGFSNDAGLKFTTSYSISVKTRVVSSPFLPCQHDSSLGAQPCWASEMLLTHFQVENLSKWLFKLYKPWLQLRKLADKIGTPSPPHSMNLRFLTLWYPKYPYPPSYLRFRSSIPSFLLVKYPQSKKGYLVAASHQALTQILGYPHHIAIKTRFLPHEKPSNCGWIRIFY